MKGRAVKIHASGSPAPVAEPWCVSLANLVRLDREGKRPITAAETQCVLEAFEGLVREKRAASAMKRTPSATRAARGDA